MNIVEVRKIVGALKAQLFKKSNSYSIGMLKSHFRGSGLQFKEHRQYTHGDDVRFIDWKILAKSGEPFIKTFEEERNVEIAVVIDAGPSMHYGWKGVSKLQAALEITCMLYLLAGETNDYIHSVILTDKVIDVPPGNGEKGITQLISILSKNNLINDKGKLQLSGMGTFENKNEKQLAIKKHLARNREMVILSDWIDLDDIPDLERVIKDKRSHCFRLLAPLDQASKNPFAMKVESGNSFFSPVTQFRAQKEETDVSRNKKIKDIEVEKRYLDLFIREMI